MKNLFIKKQLLIALCLFLSIGLTKSQTIRYVTLTGAGSQDGSSWANAAPANQLQTIITASASGDQVWVAKGTYKPTLEYGGTGNTYKTFRLKEGVKVYGGFAGSETNISQRTDFGFGQTNATTLTGDHNGNDDWSSGNYSTISATMTDNSRYVIYVYNISPALTNSCVVDGFIISGAYAGSGMFVSSSGQTHSPVVTNCNFCNNYASNYGGGVYFASTNGILSNCIIENNFSGNQGGGFYGWSNFILNNIVRNNYASIGGGFYLQFGSPCALKNCTIQDNKAEYSGAGIFAYNTSQTTNIIGNTINSNICQNGQGAGVYVQGNVNLINNTISNNVSMYQGGGIFTYNSNGEITNNTIVNNTSTGEAGGIYIYNYSPILTNNTIAYNHSDNDNNAMGSGGGIYLNSGANGYFKNNLIANNYKGSGTTNPEDFFASTTSMVDNGYNLVEYSTGYTWGGTGDITGEQASLNIDETLSGEQPQSIALLSGSVAINAGGTGTNSTVSVPLLDQRGLARNGNTDIGAFEYNGFPYMLPTNNVLFVTPNGSGTRDGSSWANAFDGANFFNDTSKLAYAMKNLSSGIQIWVAAGYYLTTSGTNRSIFFELKDGVSLFGGFAGNETSIEQRNIFENIAYLSGNIASAGLVTDNSYHVIYGGSTTSLSTTIDGFTIMQGYANGTSPHNSGGGIYLSANSSLTLKNCNIKNNYGAQGGGGMFVLSSVYFENNVIENNTCNFFGGGIYFSGNGTIKNNVFQNNSATTFSGGISISVSSGETLLFENNTLYNNTCSSSGGGTNISGAGTIVLTNNTFAYNYANQYGGAIRINNSSPIITNNTIVYNHCDFNNSGSEYGGGIEVSGTSNPKFKNNLIARNYRGNSTTTQNDFNLTSGTITNSDSNIVEISTNFTWSTNNITGSQSSLYISTELSGANPQTIMLLSNSIAINAGGKRMNAGVAIPTSDQRGKLRDANPDIGAYEAIKPFFTTHPQSVTICPALSTSFNVDADGDSLITFQWELCSDGYNFIALSDGGVYSGTQTKNLQISNSSGLNGNKYRCAAYNNYGVTYSNECVLNLYQATSITQQPDNQSICVDSQAQFSIEAQGENIGYQWYFNNILMAGQNSNTLIIPNVTVYEVGTYKCYVTGDCGNVYSNEVNLSLKTQTSIITQPLGDSKCPGDNVTFSVEATGENLQYQWYFFLTSWEIIQDATSSSLTLTNLSSQNAGYYRVIVMGDCGQVISSSAPLTIKQATQINQQPQSLQVCVGQNASFTVQATGNNLTYQWLKNGAEQVGDNSNTLFISNVQSSDVASYSCVVTGTCGTQNSESAILDIYELPIGGEVIGGETIYFGNSTPILTLQNYSGTIKNWQKQHQNEAWETINISENTFSEIPSQTGEWHYRVVVGNGSCNDSYSDFATVIVIANSAGEVNSTVSSICLGNSTGTLTLENYTGTIEYWQKKFNNESWINIPDVNTQTYSEIPQTSGQWSYRVAVNNGIETIFSSPAIINVWDYPIANFSYSANQLTVLFSNLTQNATSYLWNFGDGNISNDENPTHTYSSPSTYTVTLTGYNDVCENTFSQDITIVVGLENFYDKKYLAFPNPTYDFISIENSDLSIKNVVLIDIYGKQLSYLETQNVQKISINLSSFSKGMYFIKIQTENSFSIQKIIKLAK